MIEFDNVTFSYGGIPIFRDFSWRVDSGEAWAVLGPSGCGKSTLLSLAAGLRFPNVGEVRVDGQKMLRPRPQTGLIIQDYGLLPWQTVHQNAELGLRIRKFYGPDGMHAPHGTVPAPVQVIPWLERLGLTAVRDQYPSQISGGQRQRTAIARTLVMQPDLLLMDEPFSSLDAPTRESLQTLMLELWEEQHLTLVVVTHSIEEAAVLGQKVLLLGNPPNCVAQIIENPEAHQSGFRRSEAYLQVCQMLRERQVVL